MKRNFLNIILLLLPLFSNSCNNITGPLIQTNLLQNPSFELNGQPSISGWTVIDTAMINFSNDVPPGGGKWAIFMYGNNPLSLRPILLRPLSQKVNLLKGSYIYTFSFWAKADSTDQSAAFFRAFKSDTLEVDKSIEITNSNWTNYNIVATLSSADYDSVEVVFINGNSLINAQGKTFFDHCSLTAK